MEASEKAVVMQAIEKYEQHGNIGKVIGGTNDHALVAYLMTNEDIENLRVIKAKYLKTMLVHKGAVERHSLK